MKGLVVIAHGSRRAASNEEVAELAKAIARQPGQPFDRVSAAFLELAEPSIPDGIVACAESGCSEVVVMPYFLSAGRHVAEDIPALIAEARARLPAEVRITVRPHLGSAAAMAGFVLEQANVTAP
jgi:sirohydrochlorin ferrochelatase